MSGRYPPAALSGFAPRGGSAHPKGWLLGGEVPAVVAEVGGALRILVGPELLVRYNGSVVDLEGRLQTHAAMNDLEFPPAS